MFLAKSEQQDELFRPLKIPSYLEDSQPHPLCPLRAFKDYVKCMEGAPSEDHLFYNSMTQNPLPLGP